MKLLSFLLLLIATPSLTRAQDTNTTTLNNNTWEGCYGAGGNTELIKIGQPMFLCLHVANNKDWSSGAQFIRLAFKPKADEYSRFHVANSYKDLVGDNQKFHKGNSLTVGVGVQKALSFLRLWSQGPNDYPDKNANDLKVYPHLTAIIDVKNGIVRGITWDDACVFCSGFACDEITYDFNGNPQDKDSAEQLTKGCGKTRSECNENKSKSGTDCDLVLYVVWTGTDASGKAFLSSSNRFSAFPAQELANRLTQNLPGAAKEAGNTNDL